MRVCVSSLLLPFFRSIDEAFSDVIKKQRKCKKEELKFEEEIMPIPSAAFSFGYKKKKKKLPRRRQRRWDFESEGGEEIINSLYIPDPCAAGDIVSSLKEKKEGKED